jgi:hypothetical protein
MVGKGEARNCIEGPLGRVVEDERLGQPDLCCGRGELFVGSHNTVLRSTVKIESRRSPWKVRLNRLIHIPVFITTIYS